jgi:FRG domain
MACLSLSPALARLAVGRSGCLNPLSTLVRCRTRKRRATSNLYALRHMSTTLETVSSLGQYTERVCEIRSSWGLAEHKELWFRGEKRDYGNTRLRPTLYRPPRARGRLKPISELLSVEDSLFEAFQKCNPQLSDTVISDDFDGYLLMQHHGGPTRLLDFSDGSLMALHFALRNKRADESDSLVYVLAG